jgi:hypothetical protein
VDLDAYRSCSFGEKRQVLSVFWRSEATDSPKIQRAAAQYGPWAVGFLFVIVVELAVLLVALVATGHLVGWVVVIPGAIALFGGWRALVRSRVLKGQLST